MIHQLFDGSFIDISKIQHISRVNESSTNPQWIFVTLSGGMVSLEFHGSVEGAREERDKLVDLWKEHKSRQESFTNEDVVKMFGEVKELITKNKGD